MADTIIYVVVKPQPVLAVRWMAPQGPAGPTGQTGTSLNIQPAETPTGTQDGLNPDFVLSHPPNGLIFMLSLNGVLQRAGLANDFTLTGATITFSIAPGLKDTILVTYTY